MGNLPKLPVLMLLLMSTISGARLIEDDANLVKSISISDIFTHRSHSDLYWHTVIIGLDRAITCDFSESKYEKQTT